MPLFSIIIPVYNNSRTQLNRCLVSIQSQTFTDYEILIVDDGSNEACRKDIDDAAKGVYSCRCRVCHKEHEGVSVARNTGIRSAKGRYITFVDADDVLPPYFLSEAADALQCADVEIVYGFVRLVASAEELNSIHNDISDDLKKQKKVRVLSDNDIKELYCHMFDLSYDKFRRGKNYISRGPVARVVKKELVESCLFEPVLFLGQDAVWNLSLLRNTDKAAVVESTWYIYLRNTSSASQNFDENYKRKCSILMNRLWELANDEASKKACLGKAFEMIKTLAMKYYLPRSFKGDGIVSAVRDFNRLMEEYPWNVILRYNNIKQAGCKKILKFLLLKTNLLLPMYAVSKRLQG